MDNEEKMAKYIDSTQAILKKECKDQLIVFNKKVDELTRIEKTLPSLSKGENLEVTILRYDSSGQPIQWKHIYTTESRGRWVTSYGFSFIYPCINKEKTYHLSNVDTALVITPDASRNKIRYVPTIYFTWLSSSYDYKDFAWGLTGGIGWDQTFPTIFAGGSVFYNQNISLAAGITAHQQSYLLDRYYPGELVSLSTPESQLHDKRIVFNPFVALTFRFKENFFK
jgi:hypothetical protein